MEKKAIEEKAKDAKPTKKLPYVAPRIVVYGDLHVITANRRMTGSDGAGGANGFSL